MKTRIYGIWRDSRCPINKLKLELVCEYAYSGVSPPFRCSAVSTCGGVLVVAFKEARLNGDEKLDAPTKTIPNDGKYTWPYGDVQDVWVYGKKCSSESGYEYECWYNAGPGDLEYARERDCNYLKRILKAGDLQKLEPDVWRLREMDKAQNRDIGEWWSEKLKLSNIGDLLTNSAIEYQKYTSSEAKESKQTEFEQKQKNSEQSGGGKLA